MTPICSAPSCAIAYQAFFTCVVPIITNASDIDCDKPDVCTDTPPRSIPSASLRTTAAVGHGPTNPWR